ncbi:uncharacterized protein N7443_008630 [Penicillium atrosanguineum]|uniref:Uncharacterized protein n=1 Tax=Penicillium atrosanguineum TaxID=1132637 RepID=A0A9W9U0Z9_9EURO|nr:uncharacterized protein N7443_008630 [Penicillium atrosanguineum]KAJ5125562.1 hypothetical protein N7526_007739 [Penicillium atrosanguineum]KAJ5292677.1 hypothetical protein N7443_008630 [Penicillium atrosanguineum]KAJ5303298.1 hypothetical protein N7476_010097 [Penicillium atrosanguineum]
MPAPTIPPFLLPRGLPTARTLRTLQHQQRAINSARCFTSTSPASAKKADKGRTLAQPDKFRPPSHPARLVAARASPTGQPINYGPRLTEAQREAQKTKQYPNMFPPEGTVMFKFLTSRWIHVWIAMSILTSLAVFVFSTNFKARSPFAHLLPAWSGLLSHPIDTVSQFLQVWRMDVQHNSLRVREQRHRRVEDAEKRRQYRVAHGLEEPNESDKKAQEGKEVEVDDQSPVAIAEGEFVDWEGKKKPVKKWLGIW